MKGIYRHFKGKLYEVVDTAIDAETDQTVVIYHPMGDQRLFVRTLANFTETFERDGHVHTRFVPVEPPEPPAGQG